MSMEWEKLLSPSRLGEEEEMPVDIKGRSQFEKDCDRITFSSSFRRLGRKTQVHPMVLNDHIHTRLTHSIEVASVGRHLGYMVGQYLKEQRVLPDLITPAHVGEILQAACLAHDIGNPPFGHAGEEAIRSWFKHPNNSGLLEGLTDDQCYDLWNYEGNAQGLRVVSQLENYPWQGGMRLTYATLGTMLKYPWISVRNIQGKKFSSFISEKAILTKIANQVGLIQQDDFKWCKHPLAYLAEAADDICYRILDLEDAHELKILSLDQIKEILKELIPEDRDFQLYMDNPTLSNRRKVSYIRGKVIGKAIQCVFCVFEDNISLILEGNFKGDLIDKCPNEIKDPLNRAKEIAKKKVFKETRKVELEIGSYSVLGILLENFCKAVREQVVGEVLSFKTDRILSLMGVNIPQKEDSLYSAYMRVMDYISGMTDNYAAYIAKQIGGMGK